MNVPQDAIEAAGAPQPPTDERATRGLVHHVELWVADLEAAVASWGWLLVRLGYSPSDVWPQGRSWTLGDTYVVVESGPDVTGVHQRRNPGINHLAFHAGSRGDVDVMVVEASEHGWTLMYADRHPHAGGPTHYAAYLEDAAGHEVELVAAGA